MCKSKCVKDVTMNDISPQQKSDCWIITYTGRKFFVFDPDPDSINIKDIAHSLSLQCRYSGHCRTFYSVAEHSLRMSLENFPIRSDAALLHDAAETYISDLVTPIKKNIDFIRQTEAKILGAIWERFNIEPPTDEEWGEVKKADMVMLLTEVRDLMPMSFCIVNQEKPLNHPIKPVKNWERAEQMFLSRAAELGIVQ